MQDIIKMIRRMRFRWRFHRMTGQSYAYMDEQDAIWTYTEENDLL